MTACLRGGGCYQRALLGAVAAYAEIKADPPCASCGSPTTTCCADCVIRSAGQLAIPICARDRCVTAHLAEHRCDAAPAAPAALMAMTGGP